MYSDWVKLFDYYFSEIQSQTLIFVIVMNYYDNVLRMFKVNIGNIKHRG